MTTPNVDRLIVEFCSRKYSESSRREVVAVAIATVDERNHLLGPVIDGKAVWRRPGYMQSRDNVPAAEMPDHPGVVTGHYQGLSPADGSELLLGTSGNGPAVRIGAKEVLLRDVLNVAINSGKPPEYMASMDFSGSARYCFAVQWSAETAALVMDAAKEVSVARG